jgi:hypothetical protein
VSYGYFFTPVISTDTLLLVGVKLGLVKLAVEDSVCQAKYKIDGLGGRKSKVYLGLRD